MGRERQLVEAMILLITVVVLGRSRGLITGVQLELNTIEQS